MGKNLKPLVPQGGGNVVHTQAIAATMLYAHVPGPFLTEENWTLLFSTFGGDGLSVGPRVLLSWKDGYARLRPGGAAVCTMIGVSRSGCEHFL